MRNNFGVTDLKLTVCALCLCIPEIIPLVFHCQGPASKTNTKETNNLELLLMKHITHQDFR